MTFEQLLQEIEKRPQLYINVKSINHLKTFLDGYVCAAAVDEATEIQDFLERFQRWIEKKYSISTSHNWSKIILFYSANESRALDEFFDLYREFNSLNNE